MRSFLSVVALSVISSACVTIPDEPELITSDGFSKNEACYHQGKYAEYIAWMAFSKTEEKALAEPNSALGYRVVRAVYSLRALQPRTIRILVFTSCMKAE